MGDLVLCIKYYVLGIMRKNKGFSLVELLITLSIVVILATIAIGAINPKALIDRGKDAIRKKDLNRIKTAMEEYYSDKGNYPEAALVDQLNDKANCGSTIFKPWLSPWPCDPNGEPYKVVVEDIPKPRWFRVYVNLANKKDTSIPAGWYELTDYQLIGGVTTNEANFGVSSTNVIWSGLGPNGVCNNNCAVIENGSCKGAPNGVCTGSNCYSSNACISVCKVDCCGPDCLGD